jgi:hypothetical protein
MRQSANGEASRAREPAGSRRSVLTRLADLAAVGLLDGHSLRRGAARLPRHRDPAERPYHDADPVWVLGQRWTRDATKLAATLHLDHSQQRDRPAGWSTDNDLVVAPPALHELTPARSASELTRGLNLGDGLGIDL